MLKNKNGFEEDEDTIVFALEEYNDLAQAIQNKRKA